MNEPTIFGLNVPSTEETFTYAVEQVAKQLIEDGKSASTLVAISRMQLFCEALRKLLMVDAMARVEAGETSIDGAQLKATHRQNFNYDALDSAEYQAAQKEVADAQARVRKLQKKLQQLGDGTTYTDAVSNQVYTYITSTFTDFVSVVDPNFADLKKSLK